MGETALEISSFEYEWKLLYREMQNADLHCGSVDSPAFPAGSTQQWVLNINRLDYSDYPSLVIIPQQQNFVFAKFSISCGNTKLGCISFSKNGSSDSKELRLSYGIAFPYVIKIIGSVVSESSLGEASTGVSPKVQDSKSLLKMSEDFERLFESKQDSDITFCMGEKVVKAHRAVLIARSKVFAAMFENKLEESQTGKIPIIDTDDEVIEEMLRYMYTGKVPKLDTMTAELLDCAEKYQLDDLKEKCLKSLQTHITIENAANTLILADKFRSEELKGHAIKYIIANAKAVTETKVWKEMITTNGHLIEETFRTLALGPTVKGQK